MSISNGKLPYSCVIPVKNPSMENLDFDKVSVWVVDKRPYPTADSLPLWQSTLTLLRNGKPVLSFSQMEFSINHSFESGVSSFNGKGGMIAFLSDSSMLVVVISFPSVKERFIAPETFNDRVEKVVQITGHEYGWLILCKHTMIHNWHFAIISEESRRIKFSFELDVMDPWSSCVGLTPSGEGAFLEMYNFTERPVTSFTIRPLRSSDYVCLSKEFTRVQENVEAWSQFGSQNPVIRNQTFLKELILTRPLGILVLRDVTKYSNKNRYLQLISLSFPQNLRTYGLSFVSEIKISKNMSNFSLYGVNEKSVFVFAENKQKGELYILGLPLRSERQTFFSSARKGNVKLTINIARAFTGIVKKFNLIESLKDDN